MSVVHVGRDHREVPNGVDHVAGTVSSRVDVVVPIQHREGDDVFLGRCCLPVEQQEVPLLPSEVVLRLMRSLVPIHQRDPRIVHAVNPHQSLLKCSLVSEHGQCRGERIHGLAKPIRLHDRPLDPVGSGVTGDPVELAEQQEAGKRLIVDGRVLEENCKRQT